MDFIEDIKHYILWGGGLLIGLVLLHGFWLAWKSRRQPQEAADAPVEGAEQPQVEFAGLSPMLMEGPDREENESFRGQRDEPTTTDAWATAPAALGVGGATAWGGEETSPSPERWDDAEAALVEPPAQERQGRRIVIPGKRTEPTVPRKDRTAQLPRPAPPGLDDLVVIWVIARSREGLDGQGLLRVFTDNDLHYGGNVFRKPDPNTGRELFTVANGVEPGTFDLSDMGILATPRVVLLLRLSSLNNAIAAFEDMLHVAQELAVSLDGELKDEHMSDMSRQTIEYCRQRIRDFKRTAKRA